MIESKIRDRASFDFRHRVRSRAGLEIGIAERKVVIESHAVAPAFTRTHQTLFHPFRIGRSWKLAASQYLGFCGAMFFPLPLFFLLIPADVPVPRSLLLLVNVIPTILSLIILYLCGRMELVCFEMVVTRAKFVAPMWRRYSARVWPWIGLKILVGTAVTLLLGVLLADPLRHAVQNVGSAKMRR